MNGEIVRGLDIKEYHKGKGISSTGFLEFLRYPAAYQSYIKYGLEDSSSKSLGSHAHCALLEPHIFKEKCVWIKGPMNRNPFKKQADDAKEAGLTPIGDTDWGTIQGILEAVDKHPEAKILTTTGENEVSVYAKCPTTGLEKKCRPDTILWKRRAISDFKTIRSIDAYTTRRSIVDYQYDIKTAWYLRVLSILTGQTWTDFVHIFVETQRPFGVRCVALGDETLRRADILIEAQLPKLKACLDSGVWPGPSEGIETTEVQFFDREEYL